MEDQFHTPAVHDAVVSRVQLCGIAGQVRADQTEVHAELIARMCCALEHRGPDSRGMHIANGVGRGMQRLAIIDLSSGDQQSSTLRSCVSTIEYGFTINRVPPGGYAPWAGTPWARRAAAYLYFPGMPLTRLRHKARGNPN